MKCVGSVANLWCAGDPRATCRADANTGAGPLGYYEIVQTASHVGLFLEAVHEARIIPLDGRAQLPASVRLWQACAAEKIR